jgi:hypothetical protein
MLMQVQFRANKNTTVFNTICIQNTGVIKGTVKLGILVFLVRENERVTTFVLPALSFIWSAVRQFCIELTSDCQRR